MKNTIRKLLSILVLLIAWYFISTGLASLLGTLSVFSSINTSISLWNVQWLNVLTDPILIIGLLLALIGAVIWNWRQWRLIIGILLLVESLDAVVRAISVSHSPAPPSEFFHAPTFIFGYIFIAALSVLIGVLLIRNHRTMKKD
jgi:hypothetical protein